MMRRLYFVFYVLKYEWAVRMGVKYSHKINGNRRQNHRINHRFMLCATLKRIQLGKLNLMNFNSEIIKVYHLILSFLSGALLWQICEKLKFQIEIYVIEKFAKHWFNHYFTTHSMFQWIYEIKNVFVFIICFGFISGIYFILRSL